MRSFNEVKIAYTLQIFFLSKEGKFYVDHSFLKSENYEIVIRDTKETAE